MGNINSYLIGCCTSNNNSPENHCKLKINHSNRSFTFNKITENGIFFESSMSDISSNISTNLVNINKASEDVLMTLPGINRKIAHDIIVHRNKIGKFKKIQDIALVNGIGAEKFEHIKSEIATNSFCINEVKEILINVFNIFQLTEINGFTQELAEKIFHYRQKKGPFKCMNDFLRVPGMNIKFLEKIKPFIKFTISDDKESYVNQNHLEISSLQNRQNSNESFIKFAANDEAKFNFFLSVVKLGQDFDNQIDDILCQDIPHDRPAIFIVLYSESNNNSIKLIHAKLVHLYGADHFTFLECHAGSDCIHNNEKGRLAIISNCKKYCESISLNSLNEDVLIFMVSTFKRGNKHQFSFLALFEPVCKTSNSDEDKSVFLNDVALKLKSESKNNLVFLCDSTLKEFAISVFEKNGYQINNNSIVESEESCDISINHLQNEFHSSSNYKIQRKHLVSDPTKNINQNNFDVCILLS